MTILRCAGIIGAIAGCGGSTAPGAIGGDAPHGGGPMLLVDGTAGNAVIPGWDPAAPVPIAVLAHYTGMTTWVVSTLATIEATGVVGGLVNTDHIEVYGYPAAEPAIVFDGPLATAAVPGWDPAAPGALIALGRYTGTDRWVVATEFAIDASGAIDGLVGADRLVVWRFAHPGTPVYDGSNTSATLPSWDSAAPSPLVATGHHTGTQSWYTTMADVTDTGAIGRSLVNLDRLVVWDP